MSNDAKRRPPRWLFAVLAAGGLVACGIYIGLIRAGDASTGHLIRAVLFGVLGLIMLWGALAPAR